MKKGFFKAFEDLSLITEIGLSMIIPIIGCLWFGNFLDKKFDASPWFLAIFTILGVGGAFRNLYVLAIKRRRR